MNISNVNFLKSPLERLLRFKKLYTSPTSLVDFAPNNYFEFPENCQIPNLGYIYETIFGRLPKTLLEIGAFDGISYSNSSGLIQAGWNAILLEPVPEYASLCRSRYNNNPRVSIYEIAVSNFIGFEQIALCGPLSSTDNDLVKEFQQLPWASSSVTSNSIEVKTTTLRIFLEDHGTTDISLFIVDVEGSESKVFSEFENISFRPAMIIVELTDFHPTLKSKRIEHLEVGMKIQKCGYTIIYKDSINTVFVRDHIVDLFIRSDNY